MLTPTDLLNSAKEIGKLPGSEAIHRAAISRFYYACYHSSNQFYMSLPVPSTVLSSSGRHNHFIKSLNNPSPHLPLSLQQQSISIGKALAALRDLRLLADYNLAAHIQPKHPSGAAKLAASIFSVR
jgi:hypothetical protein